MILGHVLLLICFPQGTIDTIPWPAMSSDMNPIEHYGMIWEANNRVPACQNLHELRYA